MSIKKQVIQDKPNYMQLLEKKFKTWTNLDDEEIPEALQDLCGDSFFEMRKLTAQVCKAVESSGLDDATAKKTVVEIKTIIDSSWRSIIDKQKVGMDKLGIIIRKHLKI